MTEQQDQWDESVRGKKNALTQRGKELNSIEARPEGTEPLSDAKVDALEANFSTNSWCKPPDGCQRKSALRERRRAREERRMWEIMM